MTELITREELIEALIYNPETGEFRWRHRRRGMRHGGIAGNRPDGGYARINLNYRLYGSHRLAWLYVYGKWPDAMIDHIDGDPSNNAITNLREATNEQNMRNRKKPRQNVSGYKGVIWNKRDRKWLARIQVRGRQIYLGQYDSREEAWAAYVSAAPAYHGEFANIGDGR